jgi:hypothetical protein
MFDDCSSPAKTTWEDKIAPTSITSLDPILFTDSRTGHTVSHPCCRFHRKQNPMEGIYDQA